MTAMFTLGISPDRQGYSVDEGDTNIAIMLDGGGPRVRADQLGAVKTVHCQWSLGSADYDYFEAFYRTGANSGGTAFQIVLPGIDSSTPTLYTAWFVPKTKRLISQSGLTYVVGASLWVQPLLPDPNDDIQLLGRYS